MTDLTNIKPKKLYSSKETAEFLGFNPQTVRQLCKAGRLKAFKTRGYKILGENISHFAAGTATEK